MNDQSPGAFTVQVISQLASRNELGDQDLIELQQIAIRALQKRGVMSKLGDIQLSNDQKPDVLQPDIMPPPFGSYRNFDLRLSQVNDDEHQLLVEILDAPTEGESEATVPLPLHDAFDIGLNAPARHSAVMHESDTSEVGSEIKAAGTSLGILGTGLGQALLPGNVRAHYFASLTKLEANEGLRIRLRITSEKVALIPWEAAKMDGDFLSLRPRTPIVRYVMAEEAPTPLSITGPLRVLGIISDPDGLTGLNVEKERKRIEDALEPLIRSRHAHLDWLPHADTQTLQYALYARPHAIHYIGHANYYDDRRGGVLWFKTGDGKPEELPDEFLATLLRDSTVRFVFLNTCESGHTGGLCQMLVKRGIPAALGMQTTILDEVAINFATGFYRALSNRWSVDSAVVEGRKAIVTALKNDLNRTEWVQPVLYMRTSDGRLFE
jgi:hypothetical protein